MRIIWWSDDHRRNTQNIANSPRMNWCTAVVYLWRNINNLSEKRNSLSVIFFNVSFPPEQNSYAANVGRRHEITLPTAQPSTSKKTTLPTTTPTTTIPTPKPTTTQKPATRAGQSKTTSHRWTCTFEDSDWCGMEQDQFDNFDWTMQTGKTPSDETGHKELMKEVITSLLKPATQESPGIKQRECTLYFIFRYWCPKKMKIYSYSCRVIKPTSSKICCHF